MVCISFLAWMCWFGLFGSDMGMLAEKENGELRTRFRKCYAEVYKGTGGHEVYSCHTFWPNWNLTRDLAADALCYEEHSEDLTVQVEKWLARLRQLGLRAFP